MALLLVVSFCIRYIFFHDVGWHCVTPFAVRDTAHTSTSWQGRIGLELGGVRHVQQNFEPYSFTSLTSRFWACLFALAIGEGRGQLGLY